MGMATMTATTHSGGDATQNAVRDASYDATNLAVQQAAIEAARQAEGAAAQPVGQGAVGQAQGSAGAASGIVPTLQNIVATVNLDCRLDLKTIALHARNAEYNPKRFAAVIMRIREPKTTALIFASGKGKFQVNGHDHDTC